MLCGLSAVFVTYQSCAYVLVCDERDFDHCEPPGPLNLPEMLKSNLVSMSLNAIDIHRHLSTSAFCITRHVSGSTSTKIEWEFFSVHFDCSCHGL